MEMQAFTRACAGKPFFELLVTGIGPVETTLALSSRFCGGTETLQGVLNFGVAGAYPLVEHGAGMLDICLAQEEIFADMGICYRDRIEHFLAPELGVKNSFLLDTGLLEKSAAFLEKENIACRRGRFLTVNCVSGTGERGNMLAQQFKGLCENMEGAAVARVCEAFRLPCLEIRCISNLVEDRDTGNWQLKEACLLAGQAAALVAGHLMETLNPES